MLGVHLLLADHLKQSVHGLLTDVINGSSDPCSTVSVYLERALMVGEGLAHLIHWVRQPVLDAVLEQRVRVGAIGSSGAATGVRVLGLLSNAAGAQGPAAAF